MSHLREISESTVPEDTLSRAILKLPIVSPSTITLIADTTVCRKVSEALRLAYGGADTGALVPAVVSQDGTGHFVSGIFAPVGEFTAWSTLDTAFSVLASIAR